MKNIELAELTELDLININGGGRKKINGGKVMFLIEALEYAGDFLSGFGKGFSDVAKGK